MRAKMVFRRGMMGVTMVEFALIMPLLFAVIFGIIQFGFMFSSYTAVTNLVREAARVGATFYTSDDPARLDRMNQVILTQYDPSWPNATGFSELAGEYSTTPLTVTYAPVDLTNPTRSGQPMTVTLGYDYRLNLPLVDVPSFHVDATSTVRIE